MSLVKDGEINLDLLRGTPDEADHSLDFYASGIAVVWDSLHKGKWGPEWFRTFVETLGEAYGHTEDHLVKPLIKKATDGLTEGSVGLIPSWGISMEQLRCAWTQSHSEELLVPIGQCLKLLCQHVDQFPSAHAKLILGIVLGDIGAALHLSSKTANSMGFERELRQAIGPKSTVKEMLDAYYMFGLCASAIRASHDVQVLGTVKGGGPDLKISINGDGWFNVEANRREPEKAIDEKDLIWRAIDEKAQKVSPPKGQKHTQWEPCLISVDISSLNVPTSKESLAQDLLHRGKCGEYVYRGYADYEFNQRLRQLSDGLAVASVRTALLRRKGYGLAGILLTRNQYLRVDHVGIAQAEGAMLVLHKDFEHQIPACIARRVYLVDERCIPEHLNAEQ